MNFDYNYTCPSINTSINDLKSEISVQTGYMIDQCCPMLEGDQRIEFIGHFVDEIYDLFESHFEDVRRTNESMREEANKQIDNYISERDDEREEVKYLNKKIEELENEISKLQET